MNKIKIVRAEEPLEDITLVRAEVKKKDLTEGSDGTQRDTTISSGTDQEKTQEPSVSSGTADDQTLTRTQREFYNLKPKDKGRAASKPKFRGTAGATDATSNEKLVNEKIMMEALTKPQYETFGQEGPIESKVVPPVDLRVAKKHANDQLSGILKQEADELSGAENEQQRENIKRNFKPLIEEAQGKITDVTEQEVDQESKAWEELKVAAKKSPIETFKDVNATLIDRDEAEIVPELNEKYSQYGFTFSEGVGDQIIIESERGNQIRIEVDTWMSDAEEAKKMRLWMNRNQMTPYEVSKSRNLPESERVNYLINAYTENPDLYPEDALDVVNAALKENLTSYGNDIANHRKEDIAIQNRIQDFNARAKDGITPDMKDEYEQLQRDIEIHNLEKKELQFRNLDVQQQASSIDMAAGLNMRRKLAKEEKEGTFAGGIWNKLLKSVQIPAESGASIASNVMPYLLPHAGMDPLQYEQLKNEGLSEAEIRDVAKKELIDVTAEDVSTSFTDLVGSETTEAYMASEDRSMFEKAMFGLAETLPALALGGKSKALSGLMLSAMSYGHIESEMRDNPEFADVSESEKKLVSIPYAVVIGALERAGFTSLLSKNPVAKSFTNKIISSVLKKLPKDASAELLETELKLSVKQALKDGAYKIAGGMLVEGETEALQEMAGIGIKDIYNSMKEKKMFQTPDTFAEKISQVGEGGAMGIIGGGVMKGMQQAGSVIANKSFTKAGVNEAMANAIIEMGSDPNIRSLLVTNLKMQILNEETTAAEAQKQLESYDELVAATDKVPADSPNKVKATELVIEKDQLESEMEGKDPNLVADKKERVDAINEEMQNLKKPQEVEVEVTDEGVEVEPKAESELEPLSESNIIESLENIYKKLDDFGKETLGVNIPVVIAKGAVKSALVTAKATQNIAQIVKSAIEYVRDTDWYWDLSDADKKKAEQNTQRLFTDPKKVVASPSLKKMGLKKESKKVEVSEKQALKDQIRMEVRAAKEGARFEKMTRKEIAAEMKERIGKISGDVTGQKATAIYNRALKTNLSNPVQAEKFIDYVDKVSKDADYKDKSQKAYKRQSQIKKKAKKQQVEMKTVASDFAKVDPSTVEDIDLYNEMADRVYKMMKPTGIKRGKKGEVRDELEEREAQSHIFITKYVNKQLERQAEFERQLIKDKFPGLFESGLLREDMSVEDMRATMRESSEEQTTKKDKDKIRAQVKEAVDSYSDSIKETIKTGVNPLTGAEIELDKAQKEAISALLKVDVSKLNLKESFEIIDMLSEFATNGSVGRVLSTAKYHTGAEKAREMYKDTGKAVGLSNVAGWYVKNFASLPLVFNNIFASTRDGIRFMTDSGLNGIITGANQAQRKAKGILDSYSKEFSKTKPNGERFNTPRNIYERGMVAFLSRTVSDVKSEQQAEFNRRVDLINESIEYLNSNEATKKERNKGAIYQELAKDLGINKEGASMDSVRDNADHTNVEAVDWWIDAWADNYSDLKDVAKIVYNKDLGSDINYTGDVFKKRGGSVKNIEEELESRSASFSESPYHRESGSLMTANRPKKLPSDRVIDLDFDTNNYSGLEAALVDINTAADVRQLMGFMKSDAFKKMIPTEDIDLVKNRILGYVARKRNKEFSREQMDKMYKKALNTIAKTGTQQALGSFAQIPKQAIPAMINTVVNAGQVPNLSVAMSKDFIDWIQEAPIASRGLEADTALDTAERGIEKSHGNIDEALKAAGRLHGTYLKYFLSKPDKVVAMASFYAYYKQNLKRRGLSTDVKFSKPMDKEAMNYAQFMVDRQQNVSDPDLAGDFWTDQHKLADLTRKMVFPFANFIMNQKSRMWTDIKVLNNNPVNSSEFKAALKSLTGMMAELAAFTGISVTIRHYMKMYANYITGVEPEDEDYEVQELVDKENKKRKVEGLDPMTEEEEKSFRIEKYNEIVPAKNWKSFFTSATKDALSPFPFADEGLVWAVNNYIKSAYKPAAINSKEAQEAVDIENAYRNRDSKGDEKSMSEREEAKFREEWAEEEMKKMTLWDYESDSFADEWGVLGIAADKAVEASKMYEAAYNGTITTEKDGKKKVRYLTKENQELAKETLLWNLLFSAGILTADVGAETRYVFKNIKKSSLTEKQMDTYDEVEKELGEVTKKQVKAIKDGDSAREIIAEELGIPEWAVGM